MTPHIDPDGVPRCSTTCEHYDLRPQCDGWRMGQCALTIGRTQVDAVCEPAVAEMARKLARVAAVAGRIANR